MSRQTYNGKTNHMWNQFNDFYNENLKSLYQFVFFRVDCNSAEAEDLVSQVFMKAMKSFTESPEKIELSKAWIYTIARNTITDYYRYNSRRQNESIEEAHEMIATDDMTPSEDLVQTDLQQKVREFINELSPQKAEVVTLRFINGFNHQEIADLLKTTPGAVRVRLCTALKELKRRVENNVAIKELFYG